MQKQASFKREREGRSREEGVLLERKQNNKVGCCYWAIQLFFFVFRFHNAQKRE